ncbi:MAG: hypothetical protein WC821_00350 [archaeon]|jgi:hypothetical protein
MGKSFKPIIFIHRGDSFYLKYAFECARKYNPHSRIILLGQGVKEIPDFVEYYEISSFSKTLKSFQKIYKHYSYNNEEIERFCIERWIILSEFLRLNKIDNCLTLDSDILLFVDVTKDAEKFEKYDFTLAYHSSGALMYINRSKTISELAEYIISLYSTKQGLKKLLFFWDNYRQNTDGGGMNDMILLKWFYEKCPSRVGEVSNIIKGSLYDAAINGTRQKMVMDHGIKKVDFIEGVPYCTLSGSEKKIRMCCFHFQGPTKFYMKYFSEGRLSKTDKLTVIGLMFFRDKLSPILSTGLRSFFKKCLMWLKI